MRKNLEISKMLTLSTAHIKVETADILSNKKIDGWVVYNKSSYGWFIAMNPDYEENIDALPEDLRAVVALAIKAGCDWICLDRDGYETELLLKYEW